MGNQQESYSKVPVPIPPISMAKNRKLQDYHQESRKQPEKPNPNTDTEEEDLNTIYKAAKKALWKVLSGVTPEGSLYNDTPSSYIDTPLFLTLTPPLS